VTAAELSDRWARWTSIDCVYCGAPKGERCTSESGKEAPDSHAYRRIKTNGGTPTWRQLYWMMPRGDQ
jgi:hypothetical protein